MAHIQVHNLSYFIKSKTKFPCVPHLPQHILNNISLNFKPGLTAILGPSGCGKTTLIDVLSGRKCSSQIDCTSYTINGYAVDFDNLSSICGYVAQDDLIHGTLTVSENIKFSADLRNSAQSSTLDTNTGYLEYWN